MGASPRVGEPGAEEPRRGIRTFLIADVRGYTLFTKERGDEAAAKLAQRFAGIAREVVDRHGGSVIELRGDEALAVFDSARQAIRAATHAQERFLEETEADLSLPLAVGIGLDAGEAVPVEAGYRGGALNLAARLCGQAGPGEILASQATIHLAQRVGGIRYVDRGVLHLKGLADPVRVFRVISEEGDPAEGFRRLVPGRPARGPAPLRLARRHPALAAAVALGLVAAVVVPTRIALRGGGPGERIIGDALAEIDLGTGKLADQVALDSRPGDVAVGEGRVWVTLPDRGLVDEIDPETRTIRQTIQVGAGPVGIAVGAGSVWVANGDSSTVSRIDPETHQVVQTIEVLGGPSGIAVFGDGVWVSNAYADSVTHIDAQSGDVLATIGVDSQPVDVAVDASGVWVANGESGSVTRVDPARDVAVTTVPVGRGPQAIAAGSDGVWVVDSLDRTVSLIDPNVNGVVRTIPVGRSPKGVVVAAGSVWVSDQGGSVTRIDLPSMGRSTIPVGSRAVGMAFFDGAVWVGAQGQERLHRGGTLTVLAVAEVFDGIDPAIAYRTEAWNVLSIAYDGLVSVRRVGGLDGARLAPDLATTIPLPTNGGKTYEFQVRSGIRYSNGDPVRPEDFRRAIERVFALGSGGAAYFQTIVGAHACRPRSCDLSQGIVADDAAGTVTFQLAQPNPEFLYALALPFAFAVPATTPMKPVRTAPIPSTGPYLIESYSKNGNGKEVVFARNPEFRVWSEVARPDGFPDRIVWRLDKGHNSYGRQVSEILHNDADLQYFVPPDRFDGLVASHMGQLYRSPAAATFYMGLNTQEPPFDKVMARRAVNFALDERMIGRTFEGLGTSTCQILPSNFPGFEPYCPYTLDPGRIWSAPDVRKAQELVAASGTAGSRVTIRVYPDTYTLLPMMQLGHYLVGLLNGLGYRARIATSGPPKDMQMTFVAWGADYPAESGFIPPVLGCGQPLNLNVGRFCNPALDRRMEKATRLQLTDPPAARELWSHIEHRIVDQAPWIPLVNQLRVNLVSNRLDNFQVNPMWGLLVDQMWVR